MTQHEGQPAERRRPGSAAYPLPGRAETELVLRLLRAQADLLEVAACARSGAEGYCRGCGRWGWFTLPKPADGSWVNVMEGLSCQCGLNGRMRGILASIDLLALPDAHLADVVVFERLTPLFSHLLGRFPRLIGSEYLGPEHLPGDQGEVRAEAIRHESMLEPSYADASVDLAMHFDVLEHVPDPVAALAQCHRILRPGGWLLFSCPFYEELDSSIVRARIHEGQLQHDLPPCYHGNPVDGDGALVFTQFGWDLLDMIGKAGFPPWNCGSTSIRWRAC